MPEHDTTDRIKILKKVFKDTGTQYTFHPMALATSDYSESELIDLCGNDETLKKMVLYVKALSKRYESVVDKIKRYCEPVADEFGNKVIKYGTPWQDVNWRLRDGRDVGKFVKCRIGDKCFYNEDGRYIQMYGLWFAIETNTGGSSRGIVIDIQDVKKSHGLKPSELSEAESNYDKPQPCKYMNLEAGVTHQGFFTWTPPSEGDEDVSDGIEFQLDIAVQVRNNPRDVNVDLVMDLGNSRTVALMFEHDEGAPPMEASQFASSCLPVRLKPRFWDGKIGNWVQKDECIISSTIVLQTPLFETGKVDPETGSTMQCNARRGQSKTSEIFMDQWDYEEEQLSFFEKAKRLAEQAAEMTRQAAEKAKRLKNGESLTDESGTEPVVDEGPRMLPVKRTRRIPQMFTRLSPVVLGDEANAAISRAQDFRTVDARFVQSSPKRYYWDLNPRVVNKFWNMLPPSCEEWKTVNEVPKLRCELLRYMNLDGSIKKTLDVIEGKPESANLLSPGNDDTDTYPRASSLTWMLLALLERAWEQVHVNTDQFKQKMLSNVIITYPSGWLPCEIEMYRRRCQEAVDIFTKTHFDYDKQGKIQLVMKIDEAVASQLPYVFTEIKNIGSVTTWVELVGKNRNGRQCAHIMNLDIGGGTTDYSIIGYKSNEKSRPFSMGCDLIFKDGFAVAGDNLLRMIVDKCILGTIISKKTEIKALEKKIREHFQKGNDDASEMLTRSLHVRRVLIPMALHLLNVRTMASDTCVFSPADAGVSQGAWLRFFTYVMDNKHRFTEQELDVKEKFQFPCKLKDYVEDLFQEKFRNCASYVAAYDVDMLVLSGKTSEIPEVVDLVREVMPLPPDRIVSTKNYEAGDWYPRFGENTSQCISDAKTVTAVGAALYHVLTSNMMRDWRIQTSSSFDARNRQDHDDEMMNDRARNIWCVSMSRNKKKNIMGAGDDVSEPVLLTNQSILYRKQTSYASPEPVFMFSCDGVTSGQGYRVEFERYVDEFSGDAVRIKAVYAEDDDQCMTNLHEPGVSRFQLILHPMDKENATNWQESGICMSQQV